MIGEVVGGRILVLKACTCRTVFVGLKSNAKDSGASVPRKRRTHLRTPQSTTWKIPKIPASNVLDVIESTVVVFASYAMKTCTAEKVVVGPRARIKRALE